MSLDDRNICHKAIDDTLRRAYGEVLGEALPDRFAQLLDALKSAETQPHSRETSDV